MRKPLITIDTSERTEAVVVATEAMLATATIAEGGVIIEPGAVTVADEATQTREVEVVIRIVVVTVEDAVGIDFDVFHDSDLITITSG